MKKSIILLMASCAILASCGKMGEDGLYSRASGQEVVFSLSNVKSNSATKSEYSGDTENGIERIDWVNGEKMSVACEQTSKNYFAYTVSSVTTDNRHSKAEVTHDPGASGLKWNDNGTYYFYAMSPATQDLTPRGTGFFTLPETQIQDTANSGWNTDGSNFKSAVNPDYMQMTSYSIVEKTSDDFAPPVDLPFVMLPTVLEFTLSCEDDMTVDQVKLSSSGNITGRYYVYIDKQAGSTQNPKPVYPETGLTDGGGSKSASITLRDGGDHPVYVEQGKTITFTFMLLPQDIQNLTFFITRQDEDGNPYTLKTSLSYADGTTLKFDAHTKYRITGMIVPGGVKWTVNYDPDVEQWNNGGATPINPVPQVNYDTFVTSWDSGVEENLELTKPDYLPGLFSVSPTKQVRFSKGNLVTTVDASGAPSAWRFHENQYDSLLEGGANVTIGISEGDVDLFVWSTFDNCLYGICTEPSSINGTFADWGLTIDNDGTWRTLSMYEWDYLFRSRLNAASKFGCATVAEKHGIIIIPDGIFTDPMKNGGSNEFVPGPLPDYEQNIYSAGEDWATMESAGAVFLPVTGDGSIFYDGSMSVISCDEGNYWGSTLTGPSGSTDTLRFCYYNNYYTYTTSVFRGTGCRNAVRLVTDVN